MKISFSKHALYQLKERDLSQTLALETLNKPDKILQQTDGRFRAIKLVRKSNKNYVMMVIYDKADLNIEIVTMFITSKINKYL